MPNGLDDLFQPRDGYSRLAVWVSSIEVCLALTVLCFTVVFAAGIAGLVSIVDEWQHNVPSWSTATGIAVSAAWLFAVGAGLASIRRFAGNGERAAEHPLVLGYALDRTPSRHVLLRVAVALWWGSLAAAVLVVTTFLSLGIDDPHRAPLLQTVITLAMRIALHFGASVATSGCLLIAVVHLARSERLTRSLASLRFAFDLALVGGLLWLDTNGGLRPF